MHGPGGFSIRMILPDDIDAARALMLRTVEEDFQSAYDPRLHRDIDDIMGTYVTPARHAMFVAVDDVSGEVIGTAGSRGGALQAGPADLVQRYSRGTTAQLVRVYVRREDRRRGVARALVANVLETILADDGYPIIALHTFPHSPGALPFWESIGTLVWTYERDGQYPQAFFEISRDRARELVAAWTAARVAPDPGQTG